MGKAKKRKVPHRLRECANVLCRGSIIIAGIKMMDEFLDIITCCSGCIPIDRRSDPFFVHYWFASRHVLRPGVLGLDTTCQSIVPVWLTDAYSIMSILLLLLLLLLIVLGPGSMHRLPGVPYNACSCARRPDACLHSSSMLVVTRSPAVSVVPLPVAVLPVASRFFVCLSRLPCLFRVAGHLDFYCCYCYWCWP